MVELSLVQVDDTGESRKKMRFVPSTFFRWKSFKEILKKAWLRQPAC